MFFVKQLSIRSTQTLTVSAIQSTSYTGNKLQTEQCEKLLFADISARETT